MNDDVMIPCEHVIEKLWEYLDLGPEATDADRITRHLEMCNRCFPEYDFRRAYLEMIGLDGWLKQLLEVAFVTEYGLDADQQSVFNMLSIAGLDTTTETWEAFGESDERYKVKGGNQLVVDELAKRLDSRIHTGRQLLALNPAGEGYRLSFHMGTVTEEVSADIVVLALPFTLLREVELGIELSPEKRKAINELGYGTNAKVLAGTSSRPWRKQGFAGAAFSDQPFQLAWDNARSQPGEGGGITFYSGGKPGIAVGEGTPRSQVDRLFPGYDKVFAGASDAFNGHIFRMHWPSHAYTKGSYACYKPGQWTTISGHEAESAGNVLFAGEHCSEDFQGFMNGAAETGRVAAEEIVARVKK